MTENETKETSKTENNVNHDMVTKEEYKKEMKALRNELFYNRIAMTIFFLIALFYIHQETSRVSDVLATFMEMLLPEG